MSNLPNIPENKSGASTDTETSITFTDYEKAKEHFLLVKNRLIDVNNWQKYAGKGTAKFTLTDEGGTAVYRHPQKGDFFKIDIPGPDNDIGEGADWVQVYDVEENNSGDEGRFCISVHPASSPLNSDSATAHFFKDQASSIFCVTLSGNTVTASVHGRNETPNTDEPDLLDKFRNTLVAIGAMLGFSKIQWKSLTNGLVKKLSDDE